MLPSFTKVSPAILQCNKYIKNKLCIIEYENLCLMDEVYDAMRLSDTSKLALLLLRHDHLISTLASSDLCICNYLPIADKLTRAHGKVQNKHKHNKTTMNVTG